jgi:TolB-like protein/Flp pilus assembly protein TadD
MQFVFANHVLDPDRRELKRGSEQVALEPQVFDLLAYLIQNRDRVVSKDDLIATIWHGRVVSESNLTSRINAARKAIGDNGQQQRLIRTYARKGIRFVGDVQETRPDVEQAPESANERIAATAPRKIGAGSDTHLEPRTKPTIAVLPFNNMSGDSEQEYFSDGVTEDIIAALSKHRSLLVIARNSTFAFKGHNRDVRQVGIDLGADYLVEGSVRKIGKRIRVTAQLVETEGGGHIWADRYDRNIEDMFSMQDDITAAIAARVEPEIGTAERVRSEHKPPQTLHAWDFFRLGTMHFYKSTIEHNREAQRLLRRAIELDPGLAQAYGFLAYALVLSMVYFDAEPTEELLTEAVTIGRKGVELDEQDALVRFMYGRALLARKDYADALAELASAIDLNPNLAVVYCGLGDSLAYEGRFGEAIPHFERAINISPYDPQRWAFYSYRALAHLLAREFELAAEWAQKAIRIPNSHHWPLAHRVAALGHLQDQEASQAALAELLQRQPEFSCRLARKRLFYVKDPAHLDIYIEGLRKAGVPE